MDRIVTAHLFGRQAAKTEKKTSEAPETKLRLKLVGLIASANDRYARALIGVNAGEVNDYGIGEDIEGTEATVRAVEPRRVLLDRNGTVESLSLITPDLKSRSNGDRPGAGRQKRSGAAPRREYSEQGTAGEALPEPEGGPDDSAADSTVGSEIRYSGVQETEGRRTKLPF